MEKCPLCPDYSRRSGHGVAEQKVRDGFALRMASA